MHLIYGEHNSLIVIILNIILIGCLIYYLLKNFDNLSNPILIAFFIILGGGISNIVDRVFKGFVIDYIDINYLIKYPIFNLADIFIVVGVVLIIVCLIIKEVTEQENNRIGRI